MKLYEITSASLIMYRILGTIKASHETNEEKPSLDQFPGVRVTLYIKLELRYKTTLVAWESQNTLLDSFDKDIA
jgi:hypothetical protein